MEEKIGKTFIFIITAFFCWTPMNVKESNADGTTKNTHKENQDNGIFVQPVDSFMHTKLESCDLKETVDLYEYNMKIFKYRIINIDKK